jgi:hypothetical protein
MNAWLTKSPTQDAVLNVIQTQQHPPVRWRVRTKN